MLGGYSVLPCMECRVPSPNLLPAYEQTLIIGQRQRDDRLSENFSSAEATFDQHSIVIWPNHKAHTKYKNRLGTCTADRKNCRIP